MQTHQQQAENRSLAVSAGTQRMQVVRGTEIYQAGASGMAWRVVSGTVRLDRIDEAGETFAGLALSGDVIGAESLLFGHYSYRARAVSYCVVEPWLTHDAQGQQEGLLHALAGVQRRMADVLALRCGKAGERVRRLLTMMGEAQLALPLQRDIADITDLTIETVSRVLSQFGGSRRGGRHPRRALAAAPLRT